MTNVTCSKRYCQDFKKNDAISIYWSKRPKKLPDVFTKDETIKVLDNLKGVHWFVRILLYGSGLRLTETLELRVKDIDFGYKQIIVRNSKGKKTEPQFYPKKLLNVW